MTCLVFDTSRRCETRLQCVYSDNFCVQLIELLKIRNNINIVEKKLKFNLITRFYETMSDDKYNDTMLASHRYNTMFQRVYFSSSVYLSTSKKSFVAPERTWCN